MNCQDSRLSEIVRVAFYLATQSNIPIPRNTICEGVTIASPFTGNPVLSLALSPSSDNEAQLQNAPSLKVTAARQAAGNLFTHDLQMSLNLIPSTFRAAHNFLVGKDFDILYTHADGSQTLSYGLPNASILDIEDKLDNNPTMTLKVKLLSLSNVIPITAP